MSTFESTDFPDGRGVFTPLAGARCGCTLVGVMTFLWGVLAVVLVAFLLLMLFNEDL